MAKKLWGTRFKKETSYLADRFTSSISYDWRLAKYECLGSIAHARMLNRQKIIPKSDCKKIIKGLNSILRDIKSQKFTYDPMAEDIHTNIQHLLRKKIGKPADRLHSARSRNDLIVLNMKMYVKEAVDSLINLLGLMQKSILNFSRKNMEVIIPGYTHLQTAQAVLLSHHMLAYIEMLERDKERLADSKERADSMPLGACALSGTSLPIDRFYLAKQLGFSMVTRNSIDSVSDRDFILELLAGLTIVSMHFSRMAEDLILWSTQEFHFISIDWSFCTGSSIMPHKKNPDVLELIRASAGKILGDFSAVLVMMKGLPLTYNRDMQLDKPALFDAVDSLQEILKIFTELFKNIQVNKDMLSKKLENEALFSVDLAEYLMKKGIAYRQAHDAVGKLVVRVLDEGRKISDLTLGELKTYSAKFEKECFQFLNAKTSVSLKKCFGGTSPENVRKQMRGWERKLNARV
ncbi:MAG: argininosuccinate lyase [Omnitrophica WOR_2 bacterium RIFCSPHIGHO2_02_FULL_45_21]|nr:MAG: argininosuccinate lyase [Omnitrophica WOR_2 bacterium RIFCSPHIGHO2_02_FULL_45_21]